MLTYYLEMEHPWNSRDEQLIQFLSSNRQHKLSRYLNIRDKKLCLYAGLLARMAISSLTGVSPLRLQFLHPAGEKPRLASQPECYFNFSHTRDFVLCCASLRGEVGADVEGICKAPLDIMRLVFHPREIQYINAALPGREQDIRFYEIWTKKEAYTKRIGTGLADHPETINTLSAELSPQFHLWTQNQYKCCICSDEPGNGQVTALTEHAVYTYFSGCFSF